MEREEAASERVNVSAFVDAQVRQELEELARAEDRSMSAIVRRALDAELHREAERVAS